MLKQIPVACDDCLGTGFARQGDQVVVARVTEDRFDRGGIFTHYGRGLDGRDDLISVLVGDAFAEVRLAQRTGELSEQLRTNDELEPRLGQLVVNEARRTAGVRVGRRRPGCSDR